VRDTIELLDIIDHHCIKEFFIYKWIHPNVFFKADANEGAVIVPSEK